MESAHCRSAGHNVRAFLFVSLIALLITAAAANATPSEGNSEIDRLVNDVCARQTVLLGEDGNHAGGATLTAKVELVRRLIDECGFNAVYFESSFHDFLDFQRQLDRGKASPEMLADAIGGLWSLTSEIDPLVASLYARAKSGSVSLAGLDPRPGSATSVFTRSAFAAELGAFLPEDRRKPCIAEIDRMTNGRYESNQQEIDAREPLHECAIELQQAVSAKGHAGQNTIAAALVGNFLRSTELWSGDWYNNREKAMYDNFVWFRSRHPYRKKIIVWCATVHAARDLSFLVSDRRTLGSQIHSRRKDKVVTIGFSALGGSHGRNPKSLTTLDPAPADSLEGRAFAGVKGEQVYRDIKQLKALGVIAARPLQYAKWNSTQWSDVVDGILVFREEYPVHSVRSARPQQIGAKEQHPSASPMAEPGPC